MSEMSGGMGVPGVRSGLMGGGQECQVYWLQQVYQMWAGVSDVSESGCVSYNSAVRCIRIGETRGLRDQVYQGLGP